MSRIYAPPDNEPPLQKPTAQKRSQPSIIAFAEQLIVSLVGLVTFTAATVAVLQYFNILPPALLPLLQSIEHTIQAHFKH